MKAKPYGSLVRHTDRGSRTCAFEVLRALRHEAHEPREGERGYGYQWWIPWRSDCESVAAGAFGQMIWLDTRRGVSIGQFGAQSGSAEQTPEDTHAAMRAIVDAVTD